MILSKNALFLAFGILLASITVGTGCSDDDTTSDDAGGGAGGMGGETAK